ncbi:MAG: archease [Acidobacteriota bacterium]
MSPGAGHREIDHTADLGFELWADTLEELYAEGVRALGDICYDRAMVHPRERRELAVVGSNREECLVRWLQEVYLLLESELWLTADARDVMFDEGRVAGALYGEAFNAQRHTLHTEIKAITYHGLAVVDDGECWRATVVVDV